MRKIKSEFPIPGGAVTREIERKKNIKEYNDGFVFCVLDIFILCDIQIHFNLNM